MSELVKTYNSDSSVVAIRRSVILGDCLEHENRKSFQEQITFTPAATSYKIYVSHFKEAKLITWHLANRSASYFEKFRLITEMASIMYWLLELNP